MRIIIATLSLAFVTSLTALSTGCFVHSNSNQPSAKKSGKCAPAHHWKDGRCVHNGGGEGNGKGKGASKRK